MYVVVRLRILYVDYVHVLYDLNEAALPCPALKPRRISRDPIIQVPPPGFAEAIGVSLYE